MAPVRKLFRPSVLLPTLPGLALVAALLAFGDVRRVLALLSTFHAPALIAILLVLAGYETLQAVQWSRLLGAEGIRVPLRARLFAFLVGDTARVLPIGNYVENYLLLREEGIDLGLSSAATTVSVLIEVAVCLAGLVLLGLGSWGWLRPLILIGLGVFLSVVWALHTRRHAGALPAWLSQRRWLLRALEEVRQFRRGAAALAHPRVLAPAALLGAGYVLLGGTALYLVVRGLGVDGVSWAQVLAVYCFSIAFALIFPLPVDLGVYEASGAGAFLAVGVDKSVAVSAMLLLRALSTGTAVAVALGTIVLLRDEVRVILRGPSPPSPEAAQAGEGGSETWAEDASEE